MAKNKSVGQKELIARLAKNPAKMGKTTNWLARQFGIAQDSDKVDLLERYIAPNPKSIGLVLKALNKVVTEALRRGEAVSLPGIGTIKVVQVRARKGRNIRTGETVSIPATKRAKLSASAGLKRSLGKK